MGDLADYLAQPHPVRRYMGGGTPVSPSGRRPVGTARWFDGDEGGHGHGKDPVCGAEPDQQCSDDNGTEWASGIHADRP